MQESKLLKQVKKGDTAALAALIDRYSAYVYAVVRNIIQPPLQPEDIEEVCSDVFFSLWEHAGQVEGDKLRAWLAAVARNRAKDKLRSMRLAEPLEDDVLFLSVLDPEEKLVSLELRSLTREIIDSLPEPDRSIFKRYYYLYQKTDEIASALGMKAPTVRTRLARGRAVLRRKLTERGYTDETENH